MFRKVVRSALDTFKKYHLERSSGLNRGFHVDIGFISQKAFTSLAGSIYRI